MAFTLEPSGASCGAAIHGIDLRDTPDRETIAAIRRAWLQHQVIAFPDQKLAIEDIERFATAMGPTGEDPFIAPMAGHPRVIEVRREADETTPIFAESWHSDWSFLPHPPAGTVLYGSVIPAQGGDTLFANQYAALEALPEAKRTMLEGLIAIHSARRGYATDGLYGARDLGRSMSIRPGDSAMRTQRHPLVRRHPETGRPALFVNMGYTIGIEGFDEQRASALLIELFEHQVRPQFIYRHHWSPGMLLLWDNRCLLHAATGGYQGHQRLLYRVTVAEQVAA